MLILKSRRFGTKIAWHWLPQARSVKDWHEVLYQQQFSITACKRIIFKWYSKYYKMWRSVEHARDVVLSPRMQLLLSEALDAQQKNTNSWDDYRTRYVWSVCQLLSKWACKRWQSTYGNLLHSEAVNQLTFFQAVQFMTRASKNILKTNSYTEPKILTLLKALKTINWLLYPKTWMCISQGGRKKRHTQQYSAFTARRRMPIWVVKSLKKSSAFCDALSNT